MRQAAGDDPTRRADLAVVWHELMQALTDHLSHNDRWADPHSELIPVVRTDPFSLTSGQAFSDASADWIDGNTIDPALELWASNAHGCGKCARSMGSFLLSCGLEWTTATGLPTLRTIVESCAAASLQEGTAPWLADLANDSFRSGALRANPDLLAILDRYVEADDGYAVLARDMLE